ncbi:hypothetical protein HHI36_016060 [Cryptolaemus montrouzieri]|uniref:C2H2-type domain-containing protein n=1 Tax=Cryptolaemus montrouzieri TaxID=559131 RepID=A0ABD2N7A4_9CUCU
MEIINMSEVQITPNSRESNAVDFLTQNLKPTSNRRCLIINESIEIDLGTYSDNETDHLLLDIPQDSEDTLEMYKTDEIQTFYDDLKHEKDETSDEHDGTRLDASAVTESAEENPVLKEYVDRMFKKIAPKEGMDNLLNTDDEIWRINPPRKKSKIRNKSTNGVTEKKKKNIIKIKLKSCDKSKPKKKSPKTMEVSSKDIDFQKSYENDSFFMEEVEEVIEESTSISEKVEEIMVEPKVASNAMSLIECPYCNYKNPKEGLIKRHIITHHSGISDCPKCGYQATSRKLMKHHLEKHDIPSLKYKCSMCNCSSKGLHFLKLHILSNHKMMMFQKCRLCEFKVSSKSFLDNLKSLRNHVLHSHPRCNGSSCGDL